MRDSRVFRCGSSALSEAADISMAEGSPFAVDVVRRHLLDAMFVKFRLDEGRSGFDIEDPVPRGDPYYDTPSTGYAEIFPIEEGALNDATSGCGMNVASDGNHQLCRRIMPDETHLEKKKRREAQVYRRP